MKLLRFYAPLNGDKPGGDHWEEIQDSPDVLEQARKQGAAFISIMAFEYRPEKGKDEPRRFGPLVLDYDHKEDPEAARQDCIKTVQYLQRCGVQPDQLHFYVSGQSGFHIIVPDWIFGGQEGDPLLPKIHRQMVEYLVARVWRDEPCSLDLSMYAMGKGKLLRLENIRRGVGTYKVPVSWEELSGQRYCELIKLASAPRQIEVAPCNMKIAEHLAAQFRFCQIMVHNPPSSGLIDVSKMITKCAFIRHCIEHADTLSEPEWHAMISVVKGLGLGKYGRWLAHDWSRGYPGYSASETDKKYDAALPNIGCDKIKERFDCGRDCGVCTPSNLWVKASTAEAIDAAKSNEAEKLLKMAADFDLYPSEDSEPYADVMVNGHRETYRVESLQFRRLLGYLYFQANGKSLKGLAANDLLHDLAARALHGNAEKRKVYTRVAPLDDAVYIDMCDEGWRAIKITAEGWEVVDNPPVRFRRVAGMLPLASPVKGGSIKELRSLLNVEGREAVLLEAFLLGMLSSGPFPVLILEGEQGTAKSTTTQILRQILDPSVAPTRATPRGEQDLVIAANNSHVIALDNLSGVAPWLSDALCRIATGGSFSTRKLYTDGEEVLFCIVKPIILNGIDQIATRHDLADRSLRVTLQVISPEKRLTEEELNDAFEQAAPRILAGLCDGVVCALKNRKSVKLNNLPRMADFTKWCVAAEDAMPWEPGEFLDAYMQNQSQAIERALEADCVGNAVMLLMEEIPLWKGKPAALLVALESVVDEKVLRKQTWPDTPVALGRRLTRSQAFLRKSGINVDRQSGGDRIITISKAEAEPTTPPRVNRSIGELFD